MPAISIRGIVPRDRLSAVIVLAAVVAFLTFVGLAVRCGTAAANGVHFDPNSPAGKEYALPLAQARNDASGGGGSGGASGASAPLFGAGISGRAPIASAKGGKVGQRASGGTKRSGSQEPAESAGPRTRLPVAGGGYPVAIGAGMVAVVVLLGGGLGLALRGLQRASAG